MGGLSKHASGDQSEEKCTEWKNLETQTLNLELCGLSLCWRNVLLNFTGSRKCLKINLRRLIAMDPILMIVVVSSKHLWGSSVALKSLTSYRLDTTNRFPWYTLHRTSRNKDENDIFWCKYSRSCCKRTQGFGAEAGTYAKFMAIFPEPEPSFPKITRPRTPERTQQHPESR